MKDYREYMQDKIRSKIYDALANIVFEYDADKEDMEKAIEWFMTHFFEDNE